MKKKVAFISLSMLMAVNTMSVYAVEETEVQETCFKLSDSYEVCLQVLEGEGNITVEYPQLFLTEKGTAYEYAEMINQKFLEAAEASVEAEELSIEENRIWLLEAGMSEAVEHLCFETTCESMYLLGSAYSVMQSHYTNTGGIHPYSWVTGVTYDLNTGEEMTMGEILGCSEKVAAEAVVLAYKENIIDQVEEITEQSIRESFDAMEYWFDEEGMRVNLAPYVVASYAAGPQEVLVTQDHVRAARTFAE